MFGRERRKERRFADAVGPAARDRGVDSRTLNGVFEHQHHLKTSTQSRQKAHSNSYYLAPSPTTTHTFRKYGFLLSQLILQELHTTRTHSLRAPPSRWKEARLEKERERERDRVGEREAKSKTLYPIEKGGIETANNMKTDSVKRSSEDRQTVHHP